MSKDMEFERILGWIDRLNTSVAAAEGDQVATHKLVGSAEYELQQLRRHLSSVRPEPAQPVAVPTQGPTQSAGAQFNMKLRHPDRLRQGQH